MNAPQFSVIIPTCHRNEDLAKCLDCLAPGEQLLAPENYEVIVTDDGRDSTAEAMIQESYPWARWMQGPRRGPASNRNHGAKKAQGEWLAFTDDDCLPGAKWLASFAAGMKDADVLEGLTRADRSRISYAEEAPINLNGGYLWSCNFAISKPLFEEIGGFDEAFPAPAMEDCDFRENLREEGIDFVFIENAEVVHPWRIAKGWRFWERYLEALFYFYRKHPSLRPRSVALNFAVTGLRNFKGNVIQNLSSIGLVGFRHALIHLVWHFWTAFRCIFGLQKRLDGEK